MTSNVVRLSSEQKIELLTSDSSAEGAKDRITCQLCRRQFAKYTCPTCNAPYCSITCFRSPAHNQCSEGFYKKEIETEIHSGSSKTSQERQRMIEMLQKFEEESANETEAMENPDDSENEGEGGSSGFVERFAAVDLDSASEKAIWAALTPEERTRFLKALEDPTSQLARELLASGDLDKELEEPWWEASTVAPAIEPAGTSVPHRYGSRPFMMTIPQSMIKPVPSGHPLVYNMCSICIAYAYITRSLATSPLGNLRPDQPEYHETIRLVRQLVPFLSDRKSAILYPNLADVITDIWSSFELGKMTNELLALLLKDAASLLKPRRVSEVTMDHAATGDAPNFLSSHPHERPLLVLSDLRDVYSKRDGNKDLPSHITHKIVFYAAHIASTPTFILDTLVREIEHRIRG